MYVQYSYASSYLLQILIGQAVVMNFVHSFLIGRTGRGSFLKQDGTLSVANDNPLSLAEELGQLSGFGTSASPPIYQVGVCVAFFPI